MSDLFKYVQSQDFSLAGAGAIAGATSIILKNFAGIDGTLLTMTDFGSIGFGTLEPGNGTQEEQISFTGVTQNANGTATLTGVSTVLFISPYTATSGLAKTHAGFTPFIISNTSGFYDKLASKTDDETISGLWNFASGANNPTIGTVYAAPTTDLQIVTKKYVDDIAIAGSPKATEAIYGISKLSTAAVDPLIPIVVGDNDTRVPTQAENDALAGTSGTPSSTNKYVTADDVSDTAVSGKIVRATGTALPALSGLNLTGIALKSETDTASGAISQNDTVYVSAANTVKRLYPSAMGTGATVSTEPSHSAANKSLPLSTNGYYFNLSGGDSDNAVPLYAQVRTINTAETDFANGSEQTVYDTGNGVRMYDVCSIGTDKFFVIFQTDTAGSGAGIKTAVMTVSGTTITLGLAQGIEITGVVNTQVSCSKVDTDKVAIFYAKDSDADIYVQILTISGTTITTNTPVLVKAASPGLGGIVSAQLATNSIAVVFNPTNGTTIYGSVISVSGTTPTLGAEQTILNVSSGSNWRLGLKAISATKLLFVYANNGVSLNDKVAHIAISGATMTISSATALAAARETEYFGMVTIGINYALVLDYASATAGTLHLINTSGTNPVVESTQNLANSTNGSTYTGYSIVKVAPWTYATKNGGNGTTDGDYIIKLTVASSARLGLAQSDISDTASGTILYRYLVHTLSGITLTPGVYYIDDTGQPTANSSLTAPVLGVAISTTKILLQ